MAGSASQVLRAVVTGVAAAVAEVIVVLLVTHVAIVTAPAGLYSGESGAEIAILGVAQIALVAAVVLARARLVRQTPAESGLIERRIGPWTAMVGLGGMVLSCAAFAAWSLQDATTPLLVNTRLIAGTARMTNVGAWWPGLFAAMVALTLVAAAASPGMAPALGSRVPCMPSESDYAASPVSGS